MANEWTLLGMVKDVADRPVRVWQYGGKVQIALLDDEAELDAGNLRKLAELLDRAAMPGQEGRRDGHPLVESALAIARAEQEAVDRDE